MTIAEIITSLLATIFAGTSLVQLFQIRHLRRQSGYTADEMQIKNLEHIIHLQDEQIQQLTKEVNELREQYTHLYNQVNKIK